MKLCISSLLVFIVSFFCSFKLNAQNILDNIPCLDKENKSDMIGGNSPVHLPKNYRYNNGINSEFFYRLNFEFNFIYYYYEIECQKGVTSLLRFPLKSSLNKDSVYYLSFNLKKRFTQRKKYNYRNF